MNRFACDFRTKNAHLHLATALERCLKRPIDGFVALFVGCDSNVGDSLAPLCRRLFKPEYGRVVTYGSLKYPITAKEVPYIVPFIQKTHPDTLIIVIDAAVGKSEDVGLIKVQNEGIKPGLGVDKDLPKVGDLSIIGILGEKGGEKGCFKRVRLSVVYQMAEIIANGLQIFIQNNEKRLKFYQNKPMVREYWLESGK